MRRLHAQTTPSRWTGIAADDGRPLPGSSGFNPQGTTLNARALSGDARFIVFVSVLDLDPSDTNGLLDVYLRDRQTNELILVSAAPGGGLGDGPSYFPSISHDGRYVAFVSDATNLVANDLNGMDDAFVYDRVQRSTTRVNLGPADEESLTSVTPPTMSADGRYVFFLTAFSPWGPSYNWIRDRDTDGNGVFDEVGLTSVTVLPELDLGGSERVFATAARVVSSDGRYVVYTPSVYTSTFEYLGTRLYVLDRTTGSFMLIGAANTDPATPIEALDPDLGGEVLVYATNAPNLVASDTANDMDVFSVDLATGGHTLIRLSHAGAPTLSDVRGTVISADGRTVTFIGVEVNAIGQQLHNVYAFDRTTGESYDTSVLPDGTRVDSVVGYPSINGDGSAIALQAVPSMLVANAGGSGGVYVVTGLEMAPANVTVDSAGGIATLTVTAPVTTGWEATVSDFSEPLGLLQLSATSGNGDGSIDVSLPPNRSGLPRSYWVVIGSEHVVVTQPSGPVLYYLSPTEGPIGGGTEVTIIGDGFTPETTVTFGGVTATGVVVDSTVVIRAISPPGGVGRVDVAVNSGGGESATLPNGFEYVGDSLVAVPLAEGRYGGATTLRAALTWFGAPQAGQTLAFFVNDAAVGHAVSNAAGEAQLPLALGSIHAGTRDVRVEFAGDGTIPAATGAGALRIQPVPLLVRTRNTTKFVGQPLPSFAVDATGFVNGESLSALNGTLSFETAASSMSPPGTYPVTPVGLWSLNYDLVLAPGTLRVLKAFTAVTVTSSPNPSAHLRPVLLRATVAAVAPGAGIPTGSVVFRNDGAVIGTVPIQNGEAVLTFAFRRGAHLVTAEYAGSASYVAGVGFAVQVVR